MIDHDSIPPSPVRATRPADALRKCYASIGHKHLNFYQPAAKYQLAKSQAHNLVLLYAVGLPPSTHNESIVAGNYDDKINAFAFDFI